MRALVVTVSNRAAAGVYEDRSGPVLVTGLTELGFEVDGPQVVPDGEPVEAALRTAIASSSYDVVITTGGTGFTGRDVTPEAVEPLFEKRMEGFSAVFHRISYDKIGTSTVQSRATAGVAGATYIFVLPGSPCACKDAWDGILAAQLDYRHRPCNFVEIMPRLDEHLRRGGVS